MHITINDFDPTNHEQVETLNTLTGALLAGPRNEGLGAIAEHYIQRASASKPTEVPDAVDNDGLTETVAELEEHDADEPSQFTQAEHEGERGRTVSPYGFADPNREPGKPGEGRKRRTKAEMEEDEAYEAQQRGQQQPQSDIYRQHPHGTETGVSEADYAPPQAPTPFVDQSPFPPQQAPEAPQPPAAPPAGSSPFNF